MTDAQEFPVPLTVVTPEGPARGGVVVVQEAFGVTEHIVDVCRRLADAGWVAVAPHLFHRLGDPVLSYDDFDAVRPVIGRLVAAEIDEDVDAAFAELTAAGIAPRSSAVVGFCMGGTVAFHTAVRRPLGAAATFYGGGVAQGRFGYPSMLAAAGELQTPWLGLFGDLDHGIPTADVEALRAATDQASPETTVVRYPDAQHGFHCDDRPAVFDPAAARDGWNRTLDWFAGHIAQ